MAASPSRRGSLKLQSVNEDAPLSSEPFDVVKHYRELLEAEEVSLEADQLVSCNRSRQE